MRFESREERNIIFGIAFGFFVIQLLYVFSKNPCACVSDEFTYKQIAFDIFQGNAVSTFHYPFLYPVLLSISFVFKGYFYQAMLVENILVKTLALFVINGQLKSVVPNLKDRMLFLLMLIACPIYFLYSDWIMSENLFAPLLVITVLFYYSHSSDIADKSISFRRKLAYTVVAGGMAVGLYEIKYLALVLFPVLFLMWFWKLFYKVFNKEVASHELILIIIVWLLVILLVIGEVLAVYCLKSSILPTFGLLKDSLGFTTGSGPENTGYKILPELKWIVCYIAYTFIGAVYVIYLLYKSSRKVKLSYIEKIEIWLTGLIPVVLIYVAARHSSFVSYNGGVMLKLLGRYVSYGTMIFVVILAVYMGRDIEYYNRKTAERKYKQGSRGKDVIAALFFGFTTLFGYLILYKKILWKPAEDWLDSLRGLDNLGFREYGLIMVGVVALLIILYCFNERRWLMVGGTIVLCLINALGAYNASDFYYDNKQYVKATNALIEKYSDQSITVFSTRMDKYIGSLQSYSFLYRDQFDDGFWYLQAGISEVPMQMSESRLSLFTYLKNEVTWEEKEATVVSVDNSNVGFLLFDKTLFEDTVDRQEYRTENITDGIEIYAKYNSDLMLMVGDTIIPYRLENDEYVFIIQDNMYQGNKSEVVLYNFTDLSKEEIKIPTKSQADGSDDITEET